jgi:hypothetical protein
MENDKYDNIEWLQDNYLRDMLINMDKRKSVATSKEYFEPTWDARAHRISGRPAAAMFYDEAEELLNTYHTPTTPKEFTTAIKVSQLKRIDIPLDINNIKDGLSSDIISRLQMRLKNTTGTYERSKKVKEVTFATKPADISHLLSRDGVSAIIKLFTNSNEFEFGDSNECLDLFKTLVEKSEVTINKTLLSDTKIVKEDMSIKEFTIDYDINTVDFDVNNFNRKIESIRKDVFKIDDTLEQIDTPIYVDIYTNSIYFMQNIEITFVGDKDISSELKLIKLYTSLINNLLQILHNNIKYKLDNKFTYTKRHSDILKILSEISNIGVMTVYDSIDDTVNLQFSSENAFGLSIDIKDKE